MIGKAILAALGLMPASTTGMYRMRQAAIGHADASRQAGKAALDIIDRQAASADQATANLCANVDSLRDTLTAVVERASRS